MSCSKGVGRTRRLEVRWLGSFSDVMDQCFFRPSCARSFWCCCVGGSDVVCVVIMPMQILALL